MKKSELMELIREVLYSELPDIVSEIKTSIREEMSSMISESENGDAVRERIRSEFRKVNPGQERIGRKKPEGSSLTVNYGDEKIASGKGVLDWFAKNQGNIMNEKKEFKHSDQTMKDFMSSTFGREIK